MDVVAEMLTIAEVGADDVVYDLGCGDGRIIIEAAKQRGARGVGIDLDPRRIKQSIESTDRTGVRDTVRFLNEDLFKADIHEATVVTLFLYPDVNLRLRSKLLRDLKSGTRVVSYCHNMKQWLPDRSVKIRASYLHYWIVPANMSGKWNGATEGNEIRVPVRLDLWQEFQKVRGVAMIGNSALIVEDGAMKGGAFSTIVRGNGKEGGVSIFLDGIVQDEVVTGVLRMCDSPGVSTKWTAWRDPSTKTDLLHEG